MARFLEVADDLEIDGLTTSKELNSPKVDTRVKEELVEDVEEGDYMIVTPTIPENDEAPTNGIKVQTSRPLYNCPGCDYSSNFRNNVLRHINGKNHEGENLVLDIPSYDKYKPKEKYPCIDCEYSSNFRPNLARHEKSKHSENI